MIVGHFCPPGSGSGLRIRIRIWIHRPHGIRFQPGSGHRYGSGTELLFSIDGCVRYAVLCLDVRRRRCQVSGPRPPVWSLCLFWSASSCTPPAQPKPVLDPDPEPRMFLALQDPDPLVRGTDPDPAPDPASDPSLLS